MGLRMAMHAALWAAFFLFLLFTAQATLISRLHFWDVRLQMLLGAALIAMPGWLFLVLSARARGASWRWLVVAAAWGAFAAAWLSFTGEAILEPLSSLMTSALEPLGQTIVRASTVVAPIVEEPAKAAGVLIVLAGVRRAGVPVTVALGAAIGGLVGLAFSLAEVSHHLGEVVANIGYVDLSGKFIVDWDLIWQVAQIQLGIKLFLLGLTNHALFSALAGVGVVMAMRGRRRAAVGWFLAALLSHGLLNSIGVSVGEWLFDSLRGRPVAGQPRLVPVLVAAWLAAAATFLVAEAWAAAILVRRLRRGEDRFGPA